ncbi:hypothetical protein LshimejAT787_0604190 [Lyophyllum shimeji]|uniref:NACHT domain-containing protein n=1 Tax=Lyophyllum shimeji TaxID=47721 RepID=A0A9P3PPZ1_LYOSH|nr:hypothetical protein LshimejAT787_0604190 [Lyophyllum shimeji]
MAACTAQGAFERARNTYIELLTAKERARIEAPTSLFELLQQAQAIGSTLEHDQKRTTDRILRGVGDAASMLKPFESLLAAACKMSPAGGDLIWSSVSFILDMVRNNVEAFDQVLGFFVNMAQEMEYVKTLEVAFNDAPLVMSVVEALYVAIIDFWVKAVKHYRPKVSKRARIISGFTTLISSSYMAQKFQILEAEILKQKSRLHQVASAQHYANSASFHLQNEQQLRSARQARLVGWINAPSYEADFRLADSRRHPGTCDWIRKKKEYMQWTERTTAPFLVIYGIPGAGKTILSSWLINQARLHPRNLGDECVVLYHYFKASDDTKRTPVAALRSLVDQLYNQLHLRRHSLLSSLESDLEVCSAKNHKNFVDLWALFSSFILRLSQLRQPENPPSATIILDAMDECKGSKPLIRELQKLVHTAVGAVKVVVTARKSGDHVDEFACMSLLRPLILEISRDDVKHDIASFTRHKIGKIERLRGAQHESLRNSVIAELGKVDNHHGMFLWTYLMCKEVKRQLYVADIWRLLQNLPKGLDAMYARICRGLAENEHHRDFGRSVLQWIVASSRPLRFAELEQALRTMHAGTDGASDTSGFFDDNDTYDEGYGLGLLWSRKDIVKACGELVTYTGLDEGDMIGLIHLSARQFLSGDPSQLRLPPDLAPSLESISTFLIDIPRAECMMGTTCLEYLLTGSLHSDKYFAHPLGLERSADRPSKQGLAKRYPLFQYAVICWPEYVLDVLQTIPDDHDVRPLVTKVSSFIVHSFSIMWLEDYVRELGTEFSFYTAQRFSQLPSPTVPSEFTRWAKQTVRVLDDYAQTLSRQPQMIRICFPTPASNLMNARHPRSQVVLTASPDTSNSDTLPMSTSPTIPPLEKGPRMWLHYDPITDSLFAVDGYSDAIRLKRQIMKTGMRLRPALEAAEQGANAFHLRSAVVSTRAGFIAVTFLPLRGGSGIERLYRTVCWSLITSGTLSSASEWAEVAFIDRVETHNTNIFENRDFNGSNANIVAFGRDNTLITPGGIWNLLTEERTDGPASIYSPDPALGVTNTCFSGDGGRVARVNRKTEEEILEVEVLDISAQLYLLNFSHSGEKIVLVKQHAEDIPLSVSQRRLTFSFLCFIVDIKRSIELCVPYPISALKFPQFTKDEDKLAACIPGLGETTSEHIFESAAGGASIVVWTLVKDTQGSYLDRATMAYLFKDWISEFTFCLTPPRTKTLDADAIIVHRNGTVHRRPIDLEWLSSEEDKLRLSRNLDLAGGYATAEIVQNGNLLGVIMCSDESGERPVLALEVWSLASSKPTQLSSAREDLIASDTCFGFSLSPTGRYLVAKAQVFHVSRDGLHAVVFPFATEQFVDAVFTTDDTRVGCLYTEGCCCMLSVFDIDAEQQLALRASVRIGDIPDPQDPDFIPQPLQFNLAFNDQDSDLLAVSYDNMMESTETFLLKVVGDSLVRSDVNDQHLPGLQFSACGNYFYNSNRQYAGDVEWPELHRLADVTTAVLPEARVQHPTILRAGFCYICAPHMFRLRESGTGAMILYHKLVTDDEATSRSRVICVVPDRLIVDQELPLFLVWPEENHDDGMAELKLVIVSEGVPTVINTGIRSGEVMKEDEWSASSYAG